MARNLINKFTIAGTAIMLALVFFYSQFVGGVIYVAAEVFTLGQADCRIWSKEQALMVCSDAPVFLHGKSGTQIGDTYVTSYDRTSINDTLIEHEAVHKEQQRHYGLLFVPLYFSQSVINGCNNTFEEEAGFDKGSYDECIGREYYRN